MQPFCFATSALGFATRLQIGSALLSEPSPKVFAGTELFRCKETLAPMIEPRLVLLVAKPFARCSFHSFSGFEILRIRLQSAEQSRPLPQQALMGDLNDVPAGPPLR
jgi:hypothetical protein